MAQDSARHRLALYGAGLIIVIAAAILVAAPLWRADPGVLPAAGVVGFAIAMWALGIMPVHITTLTMFLVAVVCGVAPPNVVFSGFHSTAVWLVFGGIVISLAAQRSGLAARIVRTLITHLPARYFGMAAGIAMAGMLLGFVMPAASGRAVLMAPLAVALADSLGFAANTRARFGIVLAAGWGTTIPLFGVLPSNVVNMAFVGASESIWGVGFTYFSYTLLNFPVLGLGGIVLMAGLVALLFGAKPQKPEAPAGEAQLSGAEWRLMLILALALSLWMTDVLHGISPGWVALGAALLCVAPGIGIVSPNVMTNEINYSSWFFVAGVIGVGAIASQTGLGTAFGTLVLDTIPLTPDGGLITFYELFAIGSAVTLVTTSPAAPPIMTAFADVIAEATHWPLKSVLLAQVPTWMVYPLPHQAPPVAIAMALGGVPISAGVRLLVPYCIVAALVLLPLQYLWGRLLGAYP
jgi:di/tricarboxylate transporter